MQSESPELDALLAPVVESSQVSSPPRQVNTPDSQVNSSDGQVCSTDSETPASVTSAVVPPQLSSDQVSSKSVMSSTPHEESSLPPDTHVPDHDTPVLPGLPASYVGPPELCSYSTSVQEPVEPEIHDPSPTHEPESEICSSTTLPAPAAADLASSVSSAAEAERVDEDSEVEAGEKLAESIESSAEPQEVCSATEMSCCTSAKGTAFVFG